MKVFINQHKKMILLSLLLLIVGLSIIGTTYAYYRLSFIQNDQNIASSKCFKVTLEDSTVFLPGVLSRKKQVIPPVTATIIERISK